uniref:E3 UFM1-protein ligase 1 homolog n=1 Tax=Syphacia muris TaxID=451379 RepID=A0A0N5ACC8_9BILA
VPGTVVGGRSSYHAFYVPNEYIALVKQYIRKTLEMEQLFEVSIFKRLSISNPIGLLNEIFTPEEYSLLMFFPSVIVTRQRWASIYDEILDEMSHVNYTDLSEYLPPAFSTEEDYDKVISICTKANEDWHGIAYSPIIYKQQLLVNALCVLDDYITQKAEEAAASWKKNSKLMTKAERQKMNDDWEPKSKKKGGRGRSGKQSAKDDPNPDMITATISVEEIEAYLKKFDEFPPRTRTEIAEQILETAKVNLQTRLDSLIQNSRLISSKEEKRSFALLQENIRNVFKQICIFENGAATFPDSESSQLLSHLCRTLCTDVANMVLSYISGIERTKNFNSKLREECLQSVESTEVRDIISEMFVAVENNNIDSFHKCIAKLSSHTLCSLNLKIPDKRHRAELVKIYANELRNRLVACEDAITGLLLSLLLIFAERANVAVYASGKLVSILIKEVLLNYFYF